MPPNLAAFFERYAARYMAADAEAVADMCQTPFLAVRSGTAIPLADRAALVDHLAGLMAAYRAAGAARADIVGIEAIAQGDSAALARIHWNVRSPDGMLIRDFETSYQLLGPEPWRILSYVNHDLAQPGPR